MIFLDLEIPEYTSMRIQESKTPSLLKTIRGKGTVENAEDYGYDERLHLNFTVNEKNLIKLLKLQARFQTLCLIPMFCENLKSKIFNSYLEYQRSLLDTFLLNAGMEEEKDRTKALDDLYNENAKFLGIENIKELGYTVNPNVNDCMMVFLESFSVRTIQDSSDGAEVEMILWVCNDLTFFNGSEQEFLNNYYNKFSNKKPIYDEIDNKIESFFTNKISDINIKMNNAWNDQKTYNPDKKFEKVESPQEISVINKYIQQVEIRMMNNLVRLPIISKPKGFIQHLGKGEIGITIKIALNQKNAMEQKIIHQIKSLALYQQEYITVSDCDFYLMKGFDIKELNLCTSVIEEPNDDVDVTIVTLLFVAASTNKTELEADYFTLMERENNTKVIKYFSNFLDIVLSRNATVKIEDNNNYSDLDIESFYSDPIYKDYNNLETKDSKQIQLDQRKILDFGKIIISKSSTEPILSTTTNKEEAEIIDSNDFTLLDLISTYRQYRLPALIGYIDNAKEKIDLNEMNNIVEKLYKTNYSGILKGMSKIFFVSDIRVAKDNIYYDSIKFKLQSLVYFFLMFYVNVKDPMLKENYYNAIYDREEKVQAQFVEDTMKYFIADFFTVDDFKDIRKRFIIAISNVFKTEVYNSFSILIKSILDSEECNKYFGIDNVKINILKDDEFNPKLKEILYNCIINSFEKMREIISTNFFKQKIFMYIKTNWYSNSETILDDSLNKALDVEMEKFIKRYDDFKSKIVYEGLDNNLFNQVLLIFKLELLGIKVDKSNLFTYSSTTEEEKNNFTNKDEYKSNYDNIAFATSFETTTNYTTINHNARVYDMFSLEVQSLFVSNAIMSLLMADISFERSVLGVISTESAKNFIGPFSLSYSAIEYDMNQKLEEITKLAKGDDLATYKQSAEENGLALISRYEKFLFLKKVITKMFGEEALEYFLNSSSSFIRISNNNKDFQKIFDIKVFDNFDSPMEFLKDISLKSNTFKGIFSETFSSFDKMEKLANSKKEDELLKSFNKEADESVESLTEEIKKSFLSYQETAQIINDKTINDPEAAYPIMNATAMQSELMSEFKYVRALKSATKLMTTQYEMMMPDYEIYIIDEKEMKMAFERGYDIQNKIYALRNILSINIKKDDATNIKTAIIKLINVKPFDIGLNTVFESKNILNDEIEDPEIVYGNKFVTQRMAFKPGLLINISLDPKNNYYDFTGKIETVDLSKNIITLICTSFASELLGKSFDIDNKYAFGIFNPFSAAKATIKDILFDRGQALGRANVENVNSYLIPTGIYSMLMSKEGDKTDAYDKAIAGATGMIFTALEKAGDSLKHFYTPYNDLLQGKDLSENLTHTNSKLGNSKFITSLANSSEVIANRITENINLVDFDISFYGIEYQKEHKYQYNETYEKIDTIEKPRDIFNIGHSSFISESAINKNKAENILSELYCYERPNVKIYDVLNDIQLRNPASYWDVIESGHYATLFLGRNNYMIKRKNKTSSLSRTEIVRMCDFIDYFLKKNSQLTTCVKELYSDQIVDYVNLFRSLASIYDPSYQLDDDVVKLLKRYNAENPLTINYNSDNEIVTRNVEGYDLASNIHLAVSGYNLLACNIQTNENYFNTVDLVYDPTISNRIGRWFNLEMGSANKVKLKMFKDLPDARVRAKIIEPSFTKNIHTKDQGFEYAQSVMFQELRNYYGGKIVTLYMPDLKKNDEILLIDSRHSMQGTVIVKDFQHILDSESGLITIITPGMKIKTSTLLNDVYLSGLLGEIRYEFLSSSSNMFEKIKTSKRKFNKINQNAYVELNELLGKVSDGMPQIPITFDNIGFDFNYQANITNKEYTENKKQIENKDNTKKEFNNTKNEISFINEDEKWENVVTPRNKSHLPFKLYPLIHNGQVMIPDDDIYNTQSNESSTITKLLTKAAYTWYTIVSLPKAFKYLGQAFSQFKDYLDLSDQGTYNNIIQMFFPGFENYSLEKYDKESLAAILVSDDPLKYLLEDNAIVNYFEDVDKTPNIGFLNCQKLNQYEDSRIKKIAAIMFHFELINLVELDGRIQDANGNVTGFENAEFTVVKKIVEELNLLSKKHNKQGTWKVMIQNRLITEGPIKSDNYSYDDIGAVIYNENNIFKINKCKVEKITVELEEEGKLYSVGRNVLIYTINFNNSAINCKPTNCFLFHNYYGETDISEMSVPYGIRCELMNKLIKLAYDNSDYDFNYAIIGDFNLNVVNKENNINYNSGFANNNVYILPLGNAKAANIYNIGTTIGNKAYDNFILSDGSFLTADTTEKESIYANTSILKIMKNYYVFNTGLPLVSDHYPIYVDLEYKSEYKEQLDKKEQEQNNINLSLTAYPIILNYDKEELLKDKNKLRQAIDEAESKNADILRNSSFNKENIINKAINERHINSFLGGLVFGPVKAKHYNSYDKSEEALNDKFRLSNLFKSSIIEGVDARLVRVLELTLLESEYKFDIIEGLRTKKQQLAYYNSSKNGTVLTQTITSYHLIGRAVDISVKYEPKHKSIPLSDKLKHIADIAKVKAEKLGVRIKWGGDFKNFFDGPHFEIYDI